MAHSEKKETPEMEARMHSKGFLSRAAKMAKGKRGKKRGKKMRSKGRR